MSAPSDISLITSIVDPSLLPFIFGLFVFAIENWMQGKVGKKYHEFHYNSKNG